MRYFSLVFIILFIQEFGYSQDSIASKKSKSISNSHFSVSFETGISAGFGRYWFDDDISEWKGGGECALRGSAVSMDFGYTFNKQKSELTGTFGYNHHDYDLNNFMTEQDGTGQTISNAKASSYEVFYFLAGMKSPFTIKRSSSPYLRLSFGMIICRTPDISYSLNTYASGPYGLSPNHWNVTQPSVTGLAFAGNFGAGIESHFTENVFVLIEGDLGLTINSIHVNIISTEPSYLLPHAYYQDLGIQIITLEGGIGFGF